MSKLRLWLISVVAFGLSYEFTSGALSQEKQGLGDFLAGGAQAPAPGQAQDRTLLELKDLVFRNVVNYAYPNMAARWTTKEVAVCWENPDAAPESDRAIVRKAAEESWSASSALVFVGWSTCVPNNRGIRIRIADANPQTLGLGKMLDGVPDGMLLDFQFKQWGESCASPEEHRRQCIYTIAVHEFGHAIGFAHEQNRRDTRDDACYEKRQGGNGDTTDLTPWDINSVMNYCNPVYGNSGQLSEWDKYAVSKLYP